MPTEAAPAAAAPAASAPAAPATPTDTAPGAIAPAPAATHPASGSVSGVVVPPKSSPRVLGGTWKGTFTRKNKDKTIDESTYVVEVDSSTPLIHVTQVGATRHIVPPGVSAKPWEPLPTELQPVTRPGLQPAVWDGVTLLQKVNENRTNGNLHISLKKELMLSIEPDKKHAHFSYDTALITVGKRGSDTAKTHGEGSLSRAR